MPQSSLDSQNKMFLFGGIGGILQYFNYKFVILLFIVNTFSPMRIASSPLMIQISIRWSFCHFISSILGQIGFLYRNTKLLNLTLGIKIAGRHRCGYKTQRVNSSTHHRSTSRVLWFWFSFRIFRKCKYFVFPYLTQSSITI